MDDNSTSFEDKVKYLMDNSWISTSPMSFVKYSIEIFFDNSNSVEIYSSNDQSKRLDDIILISLYDLKKLILEIKNDKYTKIEN